MKIVLRMAAIVVVATAASTLVGAGSASAAPTGCATSLVSSLTGNAYCQGGDGWFRVRVYCDEIWPLADVQVVGPWQVPGAGVPSQATCPYFKTKAVLGVGVDLAAPV